MSVIAAGNQIRPSVGNWLLRRLAGHWQTGLGLAILLTFAVAGVVAPLAAPFPPNEQNLEDRLIPPFWVAGRAGGSHLIGTDHLGRDILSRLLYGVRIPLMIVVVSGVFSAAIGGSLGLLAGFKGGSWDVIITAIVDVQLSLPFVLLALVTVATLGANLVNLIFVLVLTTWVTFARVVRGRVLELKQKEFIMAAHAIGGTESRIVIRHILPHLIPLIIALGTVLVGRMILMESALSFLGLGVPADIPSLGGMLSEGRQYIRIASWLTTLPGLTILFLVLSVNLLGRGISSGLDPEKQSFFRS